MKKSNGHDARLYIATMYCYRIYGYKRLEIAEIVRFQNENVMFTKQR